MGEKCLKSWIKYFPDFEIIRWDESNVDLECCKYVKEAHEAKKWAFVSDYVRYKVLYEQGGVYFDTDVEVIRSFDDILEKGSFLGCESVVEDQEIRVAPGLGMAAEPRMPIYREILDDYERSSFYNEDGSLNRYTIVERTTDILKKHGLKETNDIQNVAGINVYPPEYFCPMNINTFKLNITKNSYSIHRYAASWITPRERFNTKMYSIIYRVFGEKTAQKIRTVLKKL